MRTLSKAEGLSDVRYIEGGQNCADNVSRGRDFSTEDLKKALSWTETIIRSYGDSKAIRVTGGGAGARIYRVSPQVEVGLTLL